MIGIAALGRSRSSVNRFFSQSASLHESESALYSALVLERETVGCFFDRHEIEPSLTRKVYADVERLSVLSSAQSESL